MNERGKGPFNFLSPPLLLDWCFQLSSLCTQYIEEEGAPPFLLCGFAAGSGYVCRGGRERDFEAPFVASFGPSLG